MTRIWVLALACALGACATKQEEKLQESLQPKPEAKPDERALLRDRARLVLETRCGQCHISSYETSKPKALAFFDLLDVEWAAKLKDENFTSALGRLDAPELPGGLPNTTTPEEKEVVKKYFELERSLRAATASVSAAPTPASSP